MDPGGRLPSLHLARSSSEGPCPRREIVQEKGVAFGDLGNKRSGCVLSDEVSRVKKFQKEKEGEVNQVVQEKVEGPGCEEKTGSAGMCGG